MALFRAAATVGGLTFISRIAGFARDIVMAAILGAGPVADAFFVALKLPNVFRRITAEGAFSVGFVPMFSSMEAEFGRKRAMQFASEAQSMMVAILLPFTILMILAMPWLIQIITPGFVNDPVRYPLAVEMGQITFPYILLISLVALYGGVLNSFNRFAAFAAAPVFFNLTLIAALFGLMHFTETPGHALSIGVFLSGIVQLVWMVLCAAKYKLVIRFKKPTLSPEIKKLFYLMGPAMLGAGVVQINLVVDMILASFLDNGAISWLYYADRLYQLPLSVIGIAIGTALLPALSRTIAAQDENGSQRLMKQAVLFSLVMAVPAALALIAISENLMVTLFERGAFDHTASLASAAALNAYALSLPAFILVKVFNVLFFAAKDTKTPVKYAVIAMLINTLFGILLIGWLGHVGIAMATAIAAWVHIGLLIKASRTKMTDFWAPMKGKIIKLSFASAIMVIVVMLFQAFIPNESFGAQVVQLVLMVSGGIIVYFGLLIFFRVIRIKDIEKLYKKV